MEVGAVSQDELRASRLLTRDELSDADAIFEGLTALYASKTKLLNAMVAKVGTLFRETTQSVLTLPLQRSLLNSFPRLQLFILPTHGVLIGLKAIDDVRRSDHCSSMS